jgi:demethylmenaquinone methyltransferase/2-methoxy-6-polyprenyl-1,4-benzoquinol methylase
MVDENDTRQTDFGYESVSWDEKQKRVNEVFWSVAEDYDRMNDIMSFGLHRLWKREAVALSFIRPDEKVLDLASGSGDLAYLFFKKVASPGQIVMTDINASMLSVGRQKMENRGELSRVLYALVNAENIPFPDQSFNVVSIGFGLRNVRDKSQALKEMFRVLKPGGRLIVLEFSKPVIGLLSKLYDAYSFNVLPKFGKWIANDEASYRYLAESIRRHPDQAELGRIIKESGFDAVSWFNFSGGIVTVHRAYKY